MGADLEDAWDALDDDERTLLLEWRYVDHPPVDVAAVLIRVGLALEPQPSLFPAPAHWPLSFQAFLADIAAVRGEDIECE
ncbi:MAG TPA: hypothetical protein VI172_08325 [Candidatus Dormibacteraeota bacterium]